MKFSCLQENLNKGLAHVGHLASKNVSLPILNNIMIQCENGAIKLSATNLEVGVNTIIRGKVEAEGKLTIPARTISDYVSLLSDSKVEVVSEGLELKIATKNARTTIKGQSADEFPLIPKIEHKNPYQVHTKDLKKALNQVVYAVAQDESRPEISGVFFSFSGNYLTVVATDSYRLAERKIKLVQPAKETVELIVPTRTIQELTRIIGEGAETVEMYFTENQILFVCEGIELISRVIEGRYPDYKQIIPQEHKTLATFDKEEMIKAVKSAALFSKSGINDVSLKIQPDKHQLVVASTNAQLGESITEVPAEIEGDANEGVFNYRYLIDGLQNLDVDGVMLALIDGANPGTLRAKSGTDFLYIIMPIKQ